MAILLTKRPQRRRRLSCLSRRAALADPLERQLSMYRSARRYSSQDSEPGWDSGSSERGGLVRLFAIVWAAAVMLTGSPAIAFSFTFTKIVDTDTPIPGGTGTFTDFGDRSLDHGNVAFQGTGLDQNGVYLYVDGSLSMVADTAMAIPDGIGNFTNLGSVSLDGLDLVFSGGGEDESGVYTNLGGSLSKVVDRNTPIPDGTGTFGGFGQPSLDEGAVAFQGHGPSNQNGVYLAEGGTLTTVVDLNTPIPDGTGSFEGISTTPASLDGGQVAFSGHDTENQFGIYVSSGGTLAMVADGSTPVPGGVGTFDSFQQPVIHDGVVAFMGTDALLQTGIYLAEGGTVNIAAGTGAVDIGFSVPTLDAGSVAFEAFVGTGPHGVYTNLGGVLSKNVF